MFYLANHVIAGCEGREARRSVTARLTLSREFYRASFSSEFFEQKTRTEAPAAVRKHACDG